MSIENLVKKWSPILESEKAPAIRDYRRKQVTAQILENTELEMSRGNIARSNFGFLDEAAPATNQTAMIQNNDPVLIAMIRRSMPNLMAYDVAGVQAMTGPTGLIFAMRSHYVNVSNTTNMSDFTEAFYDEADTVFSGTGSASDLSNIASVTTGTTMPTANAEVLGTTGGGSWGEMAITIEKVTVTAGSRALKTGYTTETAQDMKAVHGLDAETEIANMLQAELLAEINRELVRTIYGTAAVGAQSGVATAGTFNLDVDSNGRWSEEKFKGLVFQVEREANQIAKSTRRGKGNIVICSSDVASALNSARMINPAAAAADLTVDDTGSTFAGTLNGNIRVYVDPYASSNFMVVGFKGSNPFDAGLFYCPYTPLEFARVVDPDDFQPRLGFKSRYGLVANPFAEGKNDGGRFANAGRIHANSNLYYRKVKVINLL